MMEAKNVHLLEITLLIGALGRAAKGQIVTGFAKTLQLHTSDFSTSVTHNSRTIKDIAVKVLHIVKQ